MLLEDNKYQQELKDQVDLLELAWEHTFMLEEEVLAELEPIQKTQVQVAMEGYMAVVEAVAALKDYTRELEE